MIDKTVVIITILIGAFDSAGQPIHAIESSTVRSPACVGSGQSGLARLLERGAL